MNEKTIRRPTGPAIIFLLSALGFFFTILNSIILPHFIESLEEIQPMEIFRIFLWGATNLFISIVLFSKKYNNLLIISTVALFIPSIVALFLNITPYTVSESIFYLFLFAFTYIMVKMPNTSLREKAVKFRFIIPLFQFILIVISTIQIIQGVYEQYIETAGAYPEGTVSAVLALLPTILATIGGFLPVLCYIWLANWLTDPYKK